MSNFNSMFGVGVNAIAAQNAGLATAGKNIANVNTEGYQREYLDLESLPGFPNSPGVKATGTYRTTDQFLARREELAKGDQGKASALATSLVSVEDAIGGASGGDIVDAISRFWGGLIELTTAPMDFTTRYGVIVEARNLSNTFKRAANELTQARQESDGRVGDLVTEANRLMTQLAELNVTTLNEADPIHADQRDLAAKKLAEIVGGQARIDPDGMMVFVAGSGTVLVDGRRAATLSTQANASGYKDVYVTDGGFTLNITTTIASGKLAGEIRSRDTVAGQAATDLDTLAVNIATAVNSQHALGVTLDGGVGGNFFTATKASDFVVNSTVDNDPRKIAAAAAGQPANSGSNTNALALAALRTGLIAGGATRTASDEAIRIVAAVGAEKAKADSDEEIENARVESLDTLRDSVSGVSLEEELAQLSAYRNGAEAAAKFITTVDGLLRALLEAL